MNVVAYVDSVIERQEEYLYGVKILAPQQLGKIDIDVLFIAVYDYKQSREIREMAIQMGVNSEKIIELATNLDMDLYEPMLNGLRYFWKRMEQGGCILLHDYFCGILPGVKKAVDDFEKELGCQIAKMPIGDGESIALLKM